MAAYGALVSFTHIMEQIQHHPFPPITLDQQKMQPLIEKVSFLQDFLENYPLVVNSYEADGLKSRIANLASEAEDAILCRIESIHRPSTSQGETISSIDMHRVLDRVSDELESIVIEAMVIIENADSSLSTYADSSRSTRADPPSSSSSLLVGLEGVVFEIMDKLTGEPSDLLIIPIVGMGGIGKTTLAKSIYETPYITQHFDMIRVWQTISLEFNVEEFFSSNSSSKDFYV